MPQGSDIEAENNTACAIVSSDKNGFILDHLRELLKSCKRIAH